MTRDLVYREKVRLYLCYDRSTVLVLHFTSEFVVVDLDSGVEHCVFESINRLLLF